MTRPKVVIPARPKVVMMWRYSLAEAVKAIFQKSERLRLKGLKLVN